MHSNDNQDSDRITEFTLHEHDYGRETHFVGDSQTAHSIDRLYELIEERIPKPVAQIVPSEEDAETSADLAQKIRELAEFFEANVNQICARIGLMTGESHTCGTCGGEHHAA